MNATIVFFIVAGIIAAVIIGVVWKMRNMPQYKLSKEKDLSDGIEKWFVKVRRGLGYYYLEQTKDLPGFVNDTFATSKMQVSGHETEILAEKIIINHRMTTVNGIEVEGE
jgi:hypothetical protein